MRQINRKGNFLVFFLTISSLIIFTMLFIALYNKSKAMTESIGTEQFRLFDIYSKGERALMFIDLSGRYAAYDTAVNLASRGGLPKADCGSDAGFSYWYRSSGLPKEECYPDSKSAAKSFSKIYPNFLDSYLALYTDDELPTSKDYYSFSVSSSSRKTAVVAKTDENISIAEEGVSAAAQIDLSRGLAYPVEKNGGSGGNHYLVTSCFGKRILNGQYNNHPGIDFGHPRGASVFSVADGTVIATDNSCTQECLYLKASETWDDVCYCGSGYGNYVLIQHDGFQTMYGHLQTVLVSKGESVSKGQRIGTEGSTGLSTGPHLHFEIRINGKKVNPLCFYDTKSPDFQFDDGGDGSCSHKDECSSLSISGGTSALTSPDEKKTSSLIYEVNPSFKAVINYDFSAYDAAAEKARKIVSECSGLSSYSLRDICVLEQASLLSNSKLKIDSSCKPAESDSYKAVFEKFMQYYEQCGISEDNCYCLFEQDKSSNVPGADGSYLIRIEDDNNAHYYKGSEESGKAEMRIGVTNSFTGDFPEISHITPLVYVVRYNKGAFEGASLKFVNASGDDVEWDMGSIIIYKGNGEIAFVEPSAFENNAPDNKFLTSRQCSNYPPATYYFCATDLEHSVFTYSEDDKKVEMIHPIMKFALEIN